MRRVKELCDKYRGNLGTYELVRPTLVGRKRTRGISISDLHVPFVLDDLVKDIIKAHSGEEFCVFNGDLFDLGLISSFLKEKEIPVVVEYNVVMDIVRFAAQHFEQVILTDGNHDAGRYTRELGKLNPSIQFLVKGSPLHHIAAGRVFSESGEELPPISLPNVTYAGDKRAGWWYKIGKTIFCHRTRGFRKHELRNATFMADHFIGRGIDFQCLVSSHSHHVGFCAYRGGRLVIDQGCLCLPQHYEVDGGGGYAPIDVGYAIVEMDGQGNVNLDQTKPVYLGTFLER